MCGSKGSFPRGLKDSWFFVLLQVVGDMIQFDLRIFVRNGVVQPPTTLRETNSSPLKVDGWKMSFLFRRRSGRGYVSFKECILFSGTSAVSFREGNSLPYGISPASRLLRYENHRWCKLCCCVTGNIEGQTMAIGLDIDIVEIFQVPKVHWSFCWGLGSFSFDGEKW